MFILGLSRFLTAAGRGLVYCGLIVWLGQLSGTASSIQDHSSVSKNKIRERVTAIIKETLTRQEAVVDGIKITMALPPANSDVEEIRGYGDNAIPILAQYLNSSIGRERRLALWFLGSLGGERIVETLKRVIESDESADFRRSALMWLPAEPWELVYPILQKAVDTDRDIAVREQAQTILSERQRK